MFIKMQVWTHFSDYLDVSLEADVAKGRRDFAFTERDKVSKNYCSFNHFDPTIVLQTASRFPFFQTLNVLFVQCTVCTMYCMYNVH